MNHAYDLESNYEDSECCSEPSWETLMQYRDEKIKLAKKNLPPEQYDREIKKLVAQLGI
ncbi:hypothetical protein [Pontibacterium sp.]|uniref:hypothetical protein n=1 Tax=Pontibacterium sp. TaxID=2036026 RepID=UPI003569C348